MIVSLVGGKICYGHSRPELLDYMRRVEDQRPGRLTGCLPIDLRYVVMSNEQFVRFKNAGRRHAGGMDADGKGKHEGFSDRAREDRTDSMDLDKWDVAPYGDLVGRSGPWGNGNLTNRDHMTPDSANQLQFRNGSWVGGGGNSAGVKRAGLAITVSGMHHKTASWTFGGRTKKVDTPTGETRTQFAASDPTASFAIETDEMLRWKSDHLNGAGVRKNTLRVETVGAYAFMYAQAVKGGFIQPSINQDQMLIHYLEVALRNDDGVAR